MTDDLVGRLRALREAANPGTWMQIVVDNAELLGQMYKDAGKVEDRVAGLIYTREGGAHGKGVTLATINARRSTIERDQANAALIVEAVNALPTLLARIEALEGARDEATILIEGLVGQHSSCDFYGIGPTLRNKLATIRGTLNRPAALAKDKSDG